MNILPVRTYKLTNILLGDKLLFNWKMFVHYTLENTITKPSGERVEARRFFVQFWSLVGAIDDFQGKYLEQTFHAQTAMLSDHIAALHPDIPVDEINRRATMISVMVQGLIVIKGPFTPGDKESERFLDSAFALALNVANGIAPS